MAALQKELESKEQRLSVASAGTETLHEQLDTLKAELETEKLNTQQVSQLLFNRGAWKFAMYHILRNKRTCLINAPP